jgi:subfamily B ATP-binding cassette protein MsbA
MKLATFILRYLKGYWPWTIAAVVATAVYASATVLLIPIIGFIFGDVLRDGSALGRFGIGSEPKPAVDAASAADLGDQARIFLYRMATDGYEQLKSAFGIGPEEVVFFVPALFVVVFTLRSLSDFINGYAFQRLGFGATTDLRNDLYDRTLRQSARFHAEHPSGELVSRVVHDVGVLQSAISTRLVDLVQQSVTLLALLAMLMSINFRLALFCLIAAPAVLYPIVRFSKGMRRTSHRAQERTADLANLVSESARGHRVVKAFGMEGFEAQRFREATRRHLRANLSGQMISNLSSPVIETLGVFGAGAFLVFAGRAVQSGAMQSATLVAFLINLYAMYDPIRKLNKANLVVQQSLAAAQRLRSLMEEPLTIVDRPDARRIECFEHAIRFEDVRFAYDHREVLRGVDLEVRQGEVVAFVGPSGGGKTTLTNLLPRFFDVTGGRVALDGVDIRDLRLKDLRALIGLVTQETVLFNDTVRNNIAYGREDLPLEQVRAAARAAFADTFIAEMPEGYATVVGEGGLRLSGGQRQRIAIARALLKNAPILILDEATSQLDTESESLVQQALSNLMRGRTTLVVAHRLSTVARAARIYVVEKGRICEQGSHDELLRNGGVYRRLYELQFRE